REAAEYGEEEAAEYGEEEAAEYGEEEAAEYGEEEAAEYGEEEAAEYGEEEAAEYGEEEAAEYGEEEAAEYGEEEGEYEGEYGEEEAAEYGEEGEYEEEEGEYGEEEAAEYGEEAEYEEEEAVEYEEEEAEEYAIEAAPIAGPDGDGATPVSPVQQAPLVVRFNYSEKKRIVMSQLNSVLDNRAEQMRQLQCDEESLSGLTRAVHRINRARLCHVGCKPVTCRDEYCMAAQRLAQRFANYEAQYGFNSRLQTELQSYSAVLMLDNEYEQPMLILDEEEDGDETVGLVASRIEFEDFDQLPVESVNMWYQIETPIEFLVASQDDEQRKCAFHYMQLLDCASKRVGWSAVHVGPDTSSGVAYAVAVFDHMIMNVADPLAAVPRKVDSTTFE
uniref:OTU domain-containing protein n=1 Tax=Macrostomum lignano TaxID=282301 RepID=A0A1I8GH23_9PLAT